MDMTAKFNLLDAAVQQLVAVIDTQRAQIIEYATADQYTLIPPIAVFCEKLNRLKLALNANMLNRAWKIIMQELPPEQQQLLPSIVWTLFAA